MTGAVAMPGASLVVVVMMISFLLLFLCFQTVSNSLRNIAIVCWNLEAKEQNSC